MTRIRKQYLVKTIKVNLIETTDDSALYDRKRRMPFDSITKEISSITYVAPFEEAIDSIDWSLWEKK